MELSKKTTILLSPDLHRRLSRLAAARDVSLGELIRQACEKQYGLADVHQRQEAVRALQRMQLPVSDPAEMKLQSVPGLEEKLP